MTAGRPPKYKPEYCEQAIAAMADGKSLTAFAADIGVSRSTIQNWEKEYPEFAEASAIAKAKAQAWWEARGRAMAEGKQGNPAVVIFSLKNLGAEDFKDRQELEHSGKGGGPIQITYPAGSENL